VFTVQITWNLGSTYRRWSISITSLTILPVNLRVTQRVKEKTDRRDSIVHGSAAAAYQDAVVSVSEIIMWCDVSQVSFARGSARIALSHTPFGRPFFPQPSIPSFVRARTPPCAFLFFGVNDTRAAFPRSTCRSRRADYVIARARSRPRSRAARLLERSNDCKKPIRVFAVRTLVFLITMSSSTAGE